MNDSGLQPERTALAWKRTALSMVICSGLFFKFSLDSSSPVMGFVAGIVMVSAFLIFFASAVRGQQLNLNNRIQSPASSLIAGTTFVSLVCSCLTVALLIK
jgi:uncharacterized membrane protein YidH (DUF202 family)